MMIDNYFENLIVYQQNTVILGMQGSGKTTLAQDVLDVLPHVPRLIISPQKTKENYGGYGTPIDKISEIQNDTAMLWTGDFSKPTFELICKTLMARTANIMLLVDDVHEFCEKQKMPPQFGKLILSGRNRGIFGLYLSPFPQRVHNDILSAPHIISFKMALRSQIDWLENNAFGNDAELLLPKSLRNERKEILLDCDVDVLPKHSYMYRFDEQTENKLYIGDKQEDG